MLGLASQLDVKCTPSLYSGCFARCTEGCKGGVWFRGYMITLISQIAVNVGNNHGTFPDGRSHALHRVRANVSNGVNARDARRIGRALKPIVPSGKDEAFL